MTGSAVISQRDGRVRQRRVPGDAHLRERTSRLMRMELSFVDSSEFRGGAVDSGGLLNWREGEITGAPRPPAGLPRHLARLCEGPALTAEQERRLFRAMNYAKYRANLLRSRLDASSPDARLLDEIESLLDVARVTRDTLVRGNLRLAISVVKKFVTPQRSFDDLLSEGVEWLMSAVEKFDYTRGFRFSTYLYRAIVSNACRAGQVRRRERERCGLESELLESCPAPQSSRDERAWNHVSTVLSELLSRLDRRERFIVSGRFGLGAHRSPKTFQRLADKLGLSKERVRQLEQRAVMKLRQWCRESRLQDVMDPVLEMNGGGERWN